MKNGDCVVVLGKLDNRVREKDENELAIGTIFHVYGDNCSVLFPNGEIWEGGLKLVVKKEEQE